MTLKKILSLLVAMAMLFSCVGITAMAEDHPEKGYILTVYSEGDAYTGVEPVLNNVTFVCENSTSNAVAKIGDNAYATLDDALIAASDMTGDVTVEIYDKVTMNQSLAGSYDSIKFVGKDTDAELYMDVQGYITATGKNVAFENLMLSKATGGFIANAGFMNVAFGIYDVNSVSYTDCTFLNGAYASSGEVVFKKCTFYRSHDKYGLWAYGIVDCTVDECTFADYRGIKMYAEGAAKTVNLTVKNSNFTALDSKPAIVLTYGESVTLENNTYSLTGVFELDKGGSPNGTPVASDVAPTCKNDDGACGVIVDGKIYTTVAQAAEAATSGSTVTLLHNSTETVELAEGVILDKNGYAAENVTVAAPAGITGLLGSGTEEDPYLINNLEEFKWFRDDVNSGNDYSGEYVELTSDIDLNDEEWTPIAYNGKTFKGNFNGGNKTVKNLKITKELTNTSVNNGIGFFGRTDSPATICNLTIENVDITGSLYVGAVVGYGYTGKKIENCTVKGNITIDAWWYAGGIGGNGYMDLVNNCRVIGNTGSYIKGNDGSYIGGIWGFRGENGHKITNCTVSGISITGVDRVGGISGIAHYGNVISNCSATNVTIKATDPDATTVGLIVGACQGTESEPSVFEDNTVENVTATVGDTVITDLYGTRIDGTVPVTNFVAEVSGVQYESLTDAIAAAKAGDTIKLLADAHIAEGTDVTLPAGITLNGNGFSIFASGADHDTTTSYGYVIAGGNLTIEGITKIEKFSVGYYDRTITIGEGASLDVFGKNRVTLAYGNVFNITGTISDAKTADKAETLASLIIPAGISITGANDAAMNVKNAYVSIGSTTTKNSSTSGTIKLNFENSIAEFTNQLTFSEPTNGMNPTFNVNVKDSVLTTATKLCIAAPNTTMVVDNSTVNLGSYIRNSGELTLKNGSTLTGSTIQFGENGGNDGTIIVDRSVLTVNASSEGHAFDGKGGGLIVVKNGSTATITYLKDSYYDVDSTSTLNATLIGCTEYKVSVAQIGDTKYTSLQKALDAAAASTGNVTVEILSDINLTGIDWNPVTVSAPGYPVVTVNGNNKTITGLNDMLFAGTWAGGSGLIINDLTIKDSNIVNDENDSKGNIGVGAFIGYPQASAVITLNNCHLVNSTVKGGHWTGGLIGIAGGYSGNDGPVFMNLTIKDCSVTGSTITGKGSAGGISGHAANNAWTNVVIENTTVSGNTITSTGSSVNKAGAVMGTIGVAGQPTTANGETKTGGVSVSATVSNNTVSSGDTTITTIYGRQGSTGGVLTITGGTYENNPIEENVSYAKPAEGYEIVKNENGTYGLVEKVELFDFYGSNILLGSSLEMNFYVEKSNLDGTDYYAEVKHYDENNNVSTTEIPYSSWIASGSNYLYINYNKLVARQMSDKIEVAIFKNDGTRVSVVREDGIRANALRILNNEKYKDNPDGILTTVVDMLNYGAAAQIYFGYNEENLANAGIDNYQIHATKEDVELEDIRVKDDNKCYGTNLSLRNNIVLTGYFKGITEGMHANVKFVDHNGNNYDYDIPYNEFVPNRSYHEVRVNQLAIADANVPVTITIYDGDEAYTTLIESMNSVLYKNKAADSSNEIYQKIANFASSAQKYLDAQ